MNPFRMKKLIFQYSLLEVSIYNKGNCKQVVSEHCDIILLTFYMFLTTSRVTIKVVLIIILYNNLQCGLIKNNMIGIISSNKMRKFCESYNLHTWNFVYVFYILAENILMTCFEVDDIVMMAPCFG